ncbi:MAG: aldo/keto reductase, partial [Planctomycetes bacterium]|nr:aldo/keto reductase [Planctomycetota bacterium]
SYEALLADPAVQAVYISTPHPEHSRWAIAAAEAGKHVLCEKPLGMNAGEVMAMIDAARRHDVFLMEAFMYRCHPLTQKIAELVRGGAIGEVRMIQATFGFHWPKPHDPASRLLDPALGGGGILDVGCYPVSFARMVAGAALGRSFAEPTSLKGHGHIGATGVDEWAVATAAFERGILAQLATGVQAEQENVCRIHGSAGSILVPRPWGPGKTAEARIIVTKDGKSEEIGVVEDRPIYAIEADTVAEHCAERQAPAMSWDDSLGNARVLDQWRRAIGMQYPPEKAPSFPAPAAGRAPRFARLTQMPTGTIAGVSKPVSRLAMGLVWEATDAAALFDAFFEAGGNTFDTSWWYGEGHTDRTLGRWMASRGVRKDSVVIAKGAHTPRCFPEDVTKQLNASLEFLQTDHADIYCMHRDNPDVPIGEFVDVLNQHHRAGRIGAFGGSNWSLARVQAFNADAAKRGLKGMTTVSNNFSLASMVNPVWAGCIASSTPEYRAWHRQTQTALMAWSSQARGFFVRGRPDFTSDSELTNSWYSEDNFERKRRAEELAGKLGVTANNVALAYVLAQPFPIFCLTGPQNLDELRSTLPALAVKLTEDQVRWLDLAEKSAASA